MYDIIIIGAGWAGISACMEAKARGLSCALIEKGPLGGTCLNTGCIPTKSLIQSAKVLTQAKNRPSLALWLRLPVLIFKGPGTQTGHCFGAWQRDRVHINGTDIIRAEARLIGPDCVRAGNTDYRARWIIVATGSRPAFLKDIPFDGNNVLSSDHLLSLSRHPESLLIIGAGAIGCEFAGLFHV